MNTSYLNPKVETTTFSMALRRKDDSPLRFKGKQIGQVGTCELVDAGSEDEFNLRTTLRLFKTTGGKYVGSVEEFDTTNRDHGLRHAEFADTPEELFHALGDLYSEFLRDRIIRTGIDNIRELFANAGLSGEIPAEVEHVDEIE
jgi:hypothetical protein